MYADYDDAHMCVVFKDRKIVRCTQCKAVFKYPHLLKKEESPKNDYIEMALKIEAICEKITKRHYSYSFVMMK